MEAGILAIWHDCAPAARADYERWYMEEHLPERVGLPGFRYARRYERIEAAREYFTFYETERPDVLASPAYLGRLADPTPRTRAIMPHFANMSRTVCRKLAHFGQMTGGIALTLAIGSPPEAGAILEEGVADLKRLAGRPGVCALQLWSAAPELATGSTPESELRAGADQSVAAVLLLETSHIEEAGRLRESEPLAALLERLGDNRRVASGIYRLLCVLEHEALVA
jgi:hypothetical protein